MLADVVAGLAEVGALDRKLRPTVTAYPTVADGRAWHHSRDRRQFESAAEASLFDEHRLHLGVQDRQIDLNDAPDPTVINVHVLMRQDVAEANDST